MFLPHPLRPAGLDLHLRHHRPQDREDLVDLARPYFLAYRPCLALRAVLDRRPHHHRPEGRAAQTYLVIRAHLEGQEALDHRLRHRRAVSRESAR